MRPGRQKTALGFKFIIKDIDGISVKAPVLVNLKEFDDQVELSWDIFCARMSVLHRAAKKLKIARGAK